VFSHVCVCVWMYVCVVVTSRCMELCEFVCACVVVPFRAAQTHMVVPRPGD